VEQLARVAKRTGNGERDRLERPQTDSAAVSVRTRGARQEAQVAFVVPAAGLWPQDAGDALAVEIDPLVLVAGQSGGEVLKAFRRYVVNGVVDGDAAEGQLERRERLFQVGPVRELLESGVPDACQVGG